MILRGKQQQLTPLNFQLQALILLFVNLKLTALLHVQMK